MFALIMFISRRNFCLLYIQKKIFYSARLCKTHANLWRICGNFSGESILYARMLLYMHAYYILCIHNILYARLLKERGGDILYLSIRGILDVHVLFTFQNKTGTSQIGTSKSGLFFSGRQFGTNKEQIFAERNRNTLPKKNRLLVLYIIATETYRPKIQGLLTIRILK